VAKINKNKNMKKIILYLIAFAFIQNMQAQKVGIGTTSPAEKLDVVGNIKADTIKPTAFKLTANAGEGKILTSNANGVASWRSSLDTGAYYPAVGICCATWMTKNLDVSYYRNGDPIPQVTDATAWSNLTTGAWCYPNNDPALGAIYGKLYNWYAVNDSRGLAPYGWHIPTSVEFVTLYDCLGGDIANAGLKMKEIGATHWTATASNSGTNFSGFTALGTGARDGGVGAFLPLGTYADFWTSSENPFNTINSLDYVLYYTSPYITEYNYSKKRGCSVRCVKD
jgi:uncharacterized protein (TIGR02145 family)